MFHIFRRTRIPSICFILIWFFWFYDLSLYIYNTRHTLSHSFFLLVWLNDVTGMKILAHTLAHSVSQYLIFPSVSLELSHTLSWEPHIPFLSPYSDPSSCSTFSSFNTPPTSNLTASPHAPHWLVSTAVPHPTIHVLRQARGLRCLPAPPGREKHLMSPLSSSPLTRQMPENTHLRLALE